jgi:predicted secreted hydrolase
MTTRSFAAAAAVTWCVLMPGPRLAGRGQSPSVSPTAALATASAAALAAQPAGSAWREATAGYAFRFPFDHASHPDFQIEWWYYTGNVETPGGRRFGYQVTFFRIGVDPAPANPSRWAVRDVFMTHVAVSDAAGGRYRYAERLSRGGPGLAGALTDRYNVWNEDWSAVLDPDGRHVLRATDRGIGVDLILEAGEPPVVNGVDGISQKGERPGNASHYYSLMRMPTRGSVTIEGQRFEVAGTSWMDHEFGTSFLEPSQQGWDWLSLQLDDGSEVMLYQLRRGDGSRDPQSSGTLVRPDGSQIHLSAASFSLTPTGRVFTSRASGARYPIAWHVRVPGEGVDLEVTTPLPDQELRTAASTGISYWEGAIDVAGVTRGRRVTGRGYLEMTGYAGSMGRVLGTRR